MSRIVATTVALLIAFGASAVTATPTAVPPASVEEIIREGVARFEAGDLPGARARLEAALAAEPGNFIALYELSLTHQAAKDTDACLTTTAQGMATPSRLWPAFAALKGACLSDAGRLDEAVSTFREALQEHPDDPVINFNIAIALGRNGDGSAACFHLEKAILARPDHRSALYALGLMRSAEGKRAAGVAALLRFLMLEPSGTRAKTAARTLLATLDSTVEKTGDESFAITLPSGEMDDTVLELALSLAASGRTLEPEDGKKKPAAQRTVEALESFVEFVAEMKDEKAAANLRTIALGPLHALSGAGLWAPFGYRVLALAGDADAQRWLGAHPAEVAALDAYVHPEK